MYWSITTVMLRFLIDWKSWWRFNAYSIINFTKNNDFHICHSWAAGEESACASCAQSNSRLFVPHHGKCKSRYTCRQVLNWLKILLMVQRLLNNKFYKKIMTFTFVILEPQSRNLLVHHALKAIADGSCLTMTNAKFVILAGRF